MLIRFTKPHRAAGVGYRPGAAADLPEDQARAAIDKGVAEEGPGVKRYRIVTEGKNAAGKTVRSERVQELTEEAAGEQDGEVEEVMGLVFRHSHTLPDGTFAPGQRVTVAVSEEAWQAVNEGHCDLDPPPGVAGQPFPPEELQRDESTDVPAPQVQPLQATAAQTAALNRPQPAGMAPTTPRPVPAGRDNPNPANQPPAEKRAAVEEAAKAQAKKDSK